MFVVCVDSFGIETSVYFDRVKKFERANRGKSVRLYSNEIEANQMAGTFTYQLGFKCVVRPAIKGVDYNGVVFG